MRAAEVFTAGALLVEEIALNACLGALGCEGWGRSALEALKCAGIEGLGRGFKP